MLSLLLAAVWVGHTRIAGTGSVRAANLVGDLRAELPFYYRWVNARLGPHHNFPKPLVSRVIQADSNIDLRRGKASGELAGMGTNAWPVVPMLVEALDDSNASVGVTAASVLAQIRANEHPGWGSFEKRLSGQNRAGQVFRHLVTGRNEFAKRYDCAHRQFGLIGLAAVGPAAAEAIPDVIEVLKCKEDHELWVVAMVTLHRIGGDVVGLVPFQKGVLQDGEEWPNVRASAAKALAAGVPGHPETRIVLRRALQDEKSLVRLTAARELWRLNALPEEVIPTLTALLSHKLVTTRTGALNGISEMGSAARPIRSEVARLTSDDNESVRQAAEAALNSIGVQTNVDSESASQPGQRAGASRFAEDSNRTSSAAGSRR
jgi:hypothetical protein